MGENADTPNEKSSRKTLAREGCHPCTKIVGTLNEKFLTHIGLKMLTTSKQLNKVESDALLFSRSLRINSRGKVSKVDCFNPEIDKTCFCVTGTFADKVSAFGHVFR